MRCKSILHLAGLGLAGLLSLAPATALADVNLTPNLPAGWSWPLVPRPAADAGASSVPVPTTLTGDAAATWFNSAWRNAGSTTSGTFRNHSILDGATVIVDRSCAALAAAGTQQGINGGPFTLPAGRHTLELQIDATGVVAESNEADNNIARQWVWAPVNLPAGTRVTRAAPPATNGGWAAIPAGQDKYNNCDGLRITTGSTWDAVCVWSTDASVDYDLRCYNPSTGASNGFTTPLVTSMRDGRGIEAVITRGLGVAAHDYDIGVERYAGSGSYTAEHVTAQIVTFPDSQTLFFSQDEMLKLFYVSIPFPGQISAWLQTTTTDPSVAMEWIGASQAVVGLSELTNGAATDAQGRARLDSSVAAAGLYAFVVFRDPDWGTGPRSFGLKVSYAQTDLAPYTPAGWHSPLVVRQTMVNSGEPVTLPDTLPVATPGPIFYPAVKNVGGADGNAASEILLTLDGAAVDSMYISAFPANTGGSLYPYYHESRILTGRHTAAMEVNHDLTQLESTRANNRYGEQYCWGPTHEASATFPEPYLYPPRPGGGLDLIGDGNGEVLWPNCAASRLPKAPTNVWWQGYALKETYVGIPSHGIVLHEALDGAKDGYGEPLGRGMSFDDYTDYVLVNLNVTPRRPFDVSIVDWSDYYSEYMLYEFTSMYAESRTLGNAGNLTLAPYVSTRGDDLLQLYEWYFTAGWWMIHVDNLSPWDTIGVALHQPDEVYAHRPANAAVSPEYGEDAWLHVYVPVAGWCCVAVFMPDEKAVNTPHYQLSMYQGVSGVPDTPPLPASTALVGASPNPFNPRVTLAFDLATPARARLGIFDLKGALVRTLTDADLAAGRQEVIWDGCDADGRAVPSGAYVARFEAGEVRQTRKLMLVR